MTEFKRIDGTKLANFDLQLVVEDAGLNMELGGTQFLDVFYDPELTRDNVWVEIEYHPDELKKVTSNPAVIARLAGQKKQVFFESSQRRKLLRLIFSSRKNGNIFEWVSDFDSEKFNEFSKILKNCHFPTDNHLKIIKGIFSSIHCLDCWRQINTNNFSAARIVLRTDLEGLGEGWQRSVSRMSSTGDLSEITVHEAEVR